MSGSSSLPLILTLKLDHTTFAVMNDLRQQHFPPERNLVPAHITLFHALPGEHEDAIRHALDDRAARTPIMPLTFTKPRSLGKGVALDADSADLIRLRHDLATGWRDWLSPQDHQRYGPHLTIQNKVSPDQARRLHADLAATWEPLVARGEGVLLWRYLGGPWELIGTFPFAAPS